MRAPFDVILVFVLGSLPFCSIALNVNEDVPMYVRGSLEAQTPSKTHHCPLLQCTAAALSEAQRTQLIIKLSIDCFLTLSRKRSKMEAKGLDNTHTDQGNTE